MEMKVIQEGLAPCMKDPYKTGIAFKAPLGICCKGFDDLVDGRK